MTNSSTSDNNTDKSARDRDGSLTPRRQTAPGIRRKPRIPGVADVAGAATSQATGAVRRTSAGAAERGRAAGARVTEGTRRAGADAAERGRGASGQAVGGLRRASGGAAAGGRVGGAQVGRAAGAVTETGRSAAGTGRAGVGRLVSTSTEVAQGVGEDASKTVAGAVGSAVVSAVRIGAGMSLSFLIGKALLLLELIKRLCLAAVGALARLAERLTQRLEGASSRSGDAAHQGGVG